LDAMAIGWIVFALVFGSALLAMFVRSALPEHHLSADSKDVVKLGIALVATMSALVLSLLIASAKSAFDTRSNQLAQASADVILLNSALARYGPETKEARAMLQRWVADTVERFWPAEGTRPIAIDPKASPAKAVYDKIEELSPQSDAQRSLRSQALTMALDVGRTRLLLFEQRTQLGIGDLRGFRRPGAIRIEIQRRRESAFAAVVERRVLGEDGARFRIRRDGLALRVLERFGD